MTRLTIVIPCYDDGAYLAEAVESSLDQTHDDLEVMVMDDGSTDSETLRILSSLPSRVRVLRQRNSGVSAARNSAIAQASGDYILPLDADDVLGRTYAEHAAEVLDSRPEVGLVGCATRLFGSQDAVIAPAPPSPVDWLLANRLPASSAFRRADWEACGGYEESLRWGEDWHLWVKLVAMSRQVHVLPEIGLNYRRRPGQTTSDVPWALQELTRARVLQDGLPIMRQFPAESSLALAQQLNLLQAMRSRRSERFRHQIVAALTRRRRSRHL